MIINPEILKTHVFKDSPKYWFSYIRKFLYKDIGKLALIAQYYDFSLIGYNIQRAIIFGKMANITYVYPRNPFLWKFSWKVGVPSGNLQLVESSQYQSTYHQSYRWKFNLYFYLKLNITFDYINIFTIINYPDECYLGHLSVKTSNITSLLKYCGRHSSMMCYPPYEAINILLSIRPYIFHDLKFSFSIIDPNNIVSYSTQGIKFIKSNLIQKINYIRMFYLCTDKHKTIVIHFQKISNSIEIYDGPGTLSKKLQKPNQGKNHYIYITTYFQCVIYMYDWNEEAPNFKDNVKYFTSELPSHNIIHVNSTQLSKFLFPNDFCIDNTKRCVLKVNTLPNHKLNITIHSIKHTHNNNALCTYSGVAAYNIIDQNYKEISTVCKHKTNFYKYRNIYSNTSSILLVIYSFLEYGTLDLSLEFSDSICSVVYVNFCVNKGAYVSSIKTAHNNCLVYQTWGVYCASVHNKNNRHIKRSYLYKEFFQPVFNKEKIIIAQYIGYFGGLLMLHKYLGNFCNNC